MKRMLLVIPLFLVSCCSVSQLTWDALDANWKLIEPYAVKGISADAEIEPSTKDQRLRTVAEFTKLIKTGVEHAN